DSEGLRQHFRAHREHHRGREFQRQHRHGRQEVGPNPKAGFRICPHGQTFRQRGVTMAWFKKSDDGDSDMMNANSNGRPTAQEPTTARPEPREPRVEPRTPPVRPQDPRVEARATEARAAEARAAEARTESAPRASVLGPTLRFRGELSAQEDLIIQGSVEGSITHTQSLTVGTDGSMKGDI